MFPTRSLTWAPAPHTQLPTWISSQESQRHFKSTRWDPNLRSFSPYVIFFHCSPVQRLVFSTKNLAVALDVSLETPYLYTLSITDTCHLPNYLLNPSNHLYSQVPKDDLRKSLTVIPVDHRINSGVSWAGQDHGPVTNTILFYIFMVSCLTCATSTWGPSFQKIYSRRKRIRVKPEWEDSDVAVIIAHIIKIFLRKPAWRIITTWNQCKQTFILILFLFASDFRIVLQ